MGNLINKVVTMDTTELDHKLTNVPGFIGAFPFDDLPAKPTTDFSVIINTDSKNGPGEHWLALVRKKTVFYFHDSYGRLPDDDLFTIDFKKVMKNYINGKCVSNTKWIQQITSNVCGDHSVYFINEMETKKFSDILSVFTSNLKDNDELVLEYVKQL